MLFQAADAVAALAAAERLRAAIVERLVAVDRAQTPVTASIGVAIAPYGQTDGLIKAADSALYRVKAEARNRVVMDGQLKRPRKSGHVMVGLTHG